MTVLANRKCYLSGPIENDDLSHNWRTKPSQILTEAFQIDLFDPFKDPKQNFVPELLEAKKALDFDRMETICKSFVRKDLAMVDRADFIVAYLPDKVCTTGTKHEILNSYNAQKPTMLVCPQGKENIPAWFFGVMPHKYFFGSWQAFYDYLAEVGSGYHKDDDRWAYVYGLV